MRSCLFLLFVILSGSSFATHTSLTPRAAGELPKSVDLTKDHNQGFYQRNQGQWGTCHAFAIIPLIETLEKFRAGAKGVPDPISENWVVFLSTLDRLCDNSQNPVGPEQGWYADADLKRVFTIGYCSQAKYLPYRGTDYYNVISRAGAKGFVPGDKEKAFKETFGISSKKAKDNLCTPNEASINRLIYDRDLADPVETKFKDCLREAQTKRKDKRLKNCEVDRESWGTSNPSANENKKMKIQQALASGVPVYVSVENYSELVRGALHVDPKKHSYHAVALTGYNPKEFTVQNSWGEGQNWPIPYDKLDKIREVGFINCSTNPA